VHVSRLLLRMPLVRSARSECASRDFFDRKVTVRLTHKFTFVFNAVWLGLVPPLFTDFALLHIKPPPLFTLAATRLASASRANCWRYTSLRSAALSCWCPVIAAIRSSLSLASLPAQAADTSKPWPLWLRTPIRFSVRAVALDNVLLLANGR
jgi:hypothetical protein